MQTNQSADLSTTLPPPLRCQHAPGEATPETCAYLRALERLRARTDQAFVDHRAGRSERQLVGDFWRLHAEMATALDQCPDLAPVPVSLRRRTWWPPS